jgi:hypothetical protein
MPEFKAEGTAAERSSMTDKFGTRSRRENGLEALRRDVFGSLLA